MKFWPCSHIFISSNKVDYHFIILEITEIAPRSNMYKEVYMPVPDKQEVCPICNSHRPIPDILKLWCAICNTYWNKPYSIKDKSTMGIYPTEEAKGECPSCKKINWDILVVNMPSIHDWPFDSIDEINQWTCGDKRKNLIDNFIDNFKEKT